MYEYVIGGAFPYSYTYTHISAQGGGSGFGSTGSSPVGAQRHPLPIPLIPLKNPLKRGEAQGRRPTALPLSRQRHLGSFANCVGQPAQ